MSSTQTIACPYCGEEIKAAAIKCRYCGEFLKEPPSDEEAPEVPRTARATGQLQARVPGLGSGALPRPSARGTGSLQRPGGGSRKLVIPEGIKAQLPSLVASELAKMPPDLQTAFVEQFKRKAKTVGKAYLAWLILCHFAYVKRWPMQLLYWGTFTCWGIWWLIEAVRIPGHVKRFNQDVATEALRDIKLISR